MKPLLFFFILFLPISQCFCQSNAFKSFQIAGDSLDKHPEDYLAPIEALKKIKPDTSDAFGTNYWQQAMMTYYSFLGDYRNTLFYSDARYGNNLKPEKATCDTAFIKEHTLVDAAGYITSHLTGKQVVMINEAHHLAYNRAFVLPMLKKFYQAGYRYLAIETLDTLAEQKRYPDKNTGFYTIEPLFGELIREATHLGFKMIAYDYGTNCNGQSKDRNYCNRFRDSIMAVHLSGILKKDPNAKLLVYAGYDHINNGSDNSWKKMAQFFKEMTGIGPLSIELTKQVEHLYPQLDGKSFAAANIMGHIKSPVIALKNGQPWHTDYVDISVIFPEYLKEGQRPSYLSISGTRKFYSLKKFGIKPGEFVQAFYPNEMPGTRIPADQFVVENANEGLYLFKGEYELQVKNQDGKLIRTQKISVK